MARFARRPTPPSPACGGGLGRGPHCLPVHLNSFPLRWATSVGNPQIARAPRIGDNGRERAARSPAGRRGMRTIRALLWLGVVAVLIAMAARPAAAESLKVGLILPYSGPFARLGETMDNAVKLWVAQNPAAAGGIEIIRRDETGPNPDTVKRLAQELIQRDHVQ